MVMRIACLRTNPVGRPGIDARPIGGFPCQSSGRALTRSISLNGKIQIKGIPSLVTV
jgi:hypothetical protein